MQTPPKDGLIPVRKTSLYIRFVKSLYLVIHTLVVLAVLLGAGALYLAFRPDGLSLVKTFFLEPLGIHISRSEGSLSEGFSLHGLHSKAIDAKTLTLDYNLTTILKGEHVIDRITIDGLQINVDDFISEGGSSFPLPLFKLKEVTLTNIQLISDYPIELDLYGKEGSYDGENLNFASIQGSVKSRYASGALQGKLKNNAIRGTALVYPNAKELQSTVGRFTTLPNPQKIIIDELSDTRVRLHTALDQLTSLNDPLTSLNTINLSMDYLYQNDYLDFKANYLLVRNSDHMQTHQELRYALSGTTTSTFKGLVTSVHPLPSKILEGMFRDDTQGIAGKLTLGDAALAFQSSDYEIFAWNAQTAQKNLNFLPFLPQALQNSPFSLTAKGNYTLEKQQLQGTFRTHHNHGDINGSLRYENEVFHLNGDLALSPDAPSWSHSKLKPPKNMEISLTQNKEAIHLNLNGPSLSLALENTDGKLKGSGNYLGTYFDFGGTTSDISITSVTPSLWKTLTQIDSMELARGEYYDAEVRTNTHITYDTVLHVTTDISIPWYAAVLDSHRQYGGTNNTFSLHYDGDLILIDNYRLDIAGHDIGSKKLSTAHLDESGNLIIDELWIFDALRLNGEINTDTFAAQLALHSDRFTYKGPEGEANAAMDLLFTRDTNAIQTLTGNLQLLNAKITYLPLQQFKVMDDDVIIVQDVRPPSDVSLFINIQVTAQQPLHYLTKELDILVQPELTVWKESTGPIQLLGMVTIPQGTANTSGKTFDIKNSHLYFAGGDSVNPYLDFTILHEVDYKKINIYITHTLDSPIFLFSSDPFMSQNDIMSYLLFGSPSDTSLNTDGSKTALKTDATNFMLGAGVKGLINGATKIQIDTMNILTTQEGGMGIEVGTHLNKDLRVLYKNDTVSSVLVQYQLNRWLRLDADIHELGQGINAIYIKDFRDFLPHNSAPKEKH
ncbi:MAG: translocation/assembly module TamB domain-containing protein [Sulfuricurvum sp.]|nr:translocation/assembly module TamB domain-containing protein [Sulfuricurvum sp.]